MEKVDNNKTKISKFNKTAGALKLQLQIMFVNQKTT
jgi:hypothetical protein